MLRSISSTVCLFFVLACGEEPARFPASDPVTSGPQATVTVEFEYHAATARDVEVTSRAVECAALVGPTHIHTSWNDYEAKPLFKAGEELWKLTYDDVPVGQLRIRVSDANVCDENPTGAVTAHAVYANGVLLTGRVDTPGNGIEPGFKLRTDARGNVTP